MVEINFLLLEQVTSERDYWQWLCRWLEQRYLVGETAMVVLADDRQLGEFNRLLWIFKDCSLVPHRPYSAGDCSMSDCPVVLLSLCEFDVVKNSSELSQLHWLINCSNQCLPVANLSLTARLIEPVPAVTDIKKQMRAVYREYVKQGIEPITRSAIP